jgi:hypothetical protein
VTKGKSQLIRILVGFRGLEFQLTVMSDLYGIAIVISTFTLCRQSQFHLTCREEMFFSRQTRNWRRVFRRHRADPEF